MRFGLVMGACFAIAGAVIAATAPIVRLMGVIWLAVGIFLILLFSALIRKQKAVAALLAGGVHGTATIRDIQETNTRINDQPLLKLLLTVEAPGIPAYELEKREVVPWVGLSQLGAGRQLAVSIDPNDHSNIAIDWRGFDSAIPPVAAPYAAAPFAAAPAPVPVAAGAAPAANGASSDVAARLQQLDQLQATGAISDAEYAQKRAEILSQI